MEGLAVIVIGDGGVEVGAAAEPAPGRRQEARVHVHRGHVRIGHVGDEADPGGEEARVLFGAGDGLGEFGAELAADGRDVDPDLLEHRADHLPAHPAAARLAARVGAVPRCEAEARVRSRLPLDRLEGGADAVAQGFEPVARGLLLIVEGEHAPLVDPPLRVHEHP